MSWQKYIDKLTSDANVKQAAIVGQYGNTWGASPGFSVNGQDLISKVGRGHTPSISVNNVSYMVLRCDEDCLQGRHGADGLCIHKTGNGTLIIAVHDGNMNTAGCANAVERMRDVLTDSGY